jgi:signal transduction histidine kinase
MGEVDHMIAADACVDPRFSPSIPAHRPIYDHQLRSRLHLPMRVHGALIGTLSCSLHAAGRYGPADVRNARYVAEMLSPYLFALRASDQARQSAIVEAEARAREEGLRAGALRLTEALEQERQRIGMDLHDQTLADLTRLARRLERLQGSEAPDLTPVTDGLHQAMGHLRQIIEAAKPSVLHLFGFAQAVENQLDRAIRDSGQPLTGALTDLSNGAFDQLDATVAMALFRIVQEAVNNAVSHAQAGTIRVELALARGLLGIVIEDDGIGRARPGRVSGQGIDNMRTRARLISARLTLSSGRGDRGTRIAISLPATADQRVAS